MNSNTIEYIDIVVAVALVFVSLETYRIQRKIFEYWSQGVSKSKDPVYLEYIISDMVSRDLLYSQVL
jgi:hypothetical protein